MIATLMFMTLIVAAGFGLLQLLVFLQRGSNRAVAENALVGEETTKAYSWSGLDGALPDLLAIGAILLFAMVLLGIGYGFRA